MPRAAGDGRTYDIGIVAVQDVPCPCCGQVHGELEGLGRPVGPRDQYVSVTTVINATLPKDGLVGWAANIAVEGMLDLAQNKGWDLSTMDVDLAKSLLQEFGFTSYAKRDEKGETGTRAHQVLEDYGHAWIKAFAEGASLQEAHGAGVVAGTAAHQLMPPEEEGYGRAVLGWLDVRRPQPIMVEEPLACHCHKVAGTPDIYWMATQDIHYQRLTEVRKLVSWEISIPKGAMVLTDLKTSKSFRESHFIQAAWYGGHMLPVDVKKPVDHATVLRVNPDGTWEEKEAVGKWTCEVFLALLEVYRRVKEAE